MLERQYQPGPTHLWAAARGLLSAAGRAVPWRAAAGLQAALRGEGQCQGAKAVDKGNGLSSSLSEASRQSGSHRDADGAARHLFLVEADTLRMKPVAACLAAKVHPVIVGFPAYAVNLVGAARWISPFTNRAEPLLLSLRTFGQQRSAHVLGHRSRAPVE